MTVGIHPRMALTPVFSLPDFTRSTVADRYGLYNMPRDVSVIANLKALCERVLEPTTQRFGKRLKILSGFRTHTLNRLLGGARDSQHLLGEAADFIVEGVPAFDAALSLAAQSDLPFDELIYEQRLTKTGDMQAWISVSHRRLGDNARTVSSAFSVDGVRTLQAGLVEYSEAAAA